MSDYTPHEMMIIAAAREMAGRGVVFMGMSHPMLAGCLAKLHHDPDLIFCTEPGFIDWEPPADLARAPDAVSDPIQYNGAAFCGDMTETLAAGLMGGRLYNLAVLPTGQIDRYGNGNTLIAGDYNHPIQRIGGMGGNPDGACLAPAVMFVVPHEPRRFKERVDFITSPGYIDGPCGRDRAGLDAQGPNVIVTTLGILRYDTADGGLTGSCEAYLDAVHPGVSVEQVSANTGWDLRLAPEVKTLPPPTEQELALLRRLVG
ncbi:MAG: hypothetical protein EXR51_10705 [Dehalococcoidia bacterium]|nr:hypothetical protein [Dehalococcoidia bacterium]